MTQEEESPLSVSMLAGHPKHAPLNDQTFQSYLGNNLMSAKVNGNLSITLCSSLLDHRVFRKGIVFSLGTNHAKQIWSQSWLHNCTDKIIIENSSGFSIQCVNVDYVREKNSNHLKYFPFFFLFSVVREIPASFTLTCLWYWL